MGFSVWSIAIRRLQGFTWSSPGRPSCWKKVSRGVGAPSHARYSHQKFHELRTLNFTTWVMFDKCESNVCSIVHGYCQFEMDICFPQLALQLCCEAVQFEKCRYQYK